MSKEQKPKPMKMTVYERHDQDARYKLLGEVCETVSMKYGTGGGNTPIVVMRDDEKGED